MNESLKVNILQGKYKKAEITCEKLDIIKIRDEILDIAYDTESIAVYSFVRYMIQKTQKDEWVKIAIDVLLNPLCFIEGAYSVALFHARELLAVKRDVENLERILFFYSLPERLIDIKEAQCITREILEVEPDNKVALEVKKQ